MKSKILLWLVPLLGIAVFLTVGVFGVIKLNFVKELKTFQRLELTALAYTFAYGFVYLLILSCNKKIIPAFKLGDRIFFAAFNIIALIIFGYVAFLTYNDNNPHERPLWLAISCFLFFIASKRVSVAYAKTKEIELGEIRSKIVACGIDAPCALSFLILFFTIPKITIENQAIFLSGGIAFQLLIANLAYAIIHKYKGWRVINY